MAVVQTNIEEGVAVITIENPPVNVLSHAVREGLIEQLEEAAADDRVNAAVLICVGSTFVAGADITEFGKPPVAPNLMEVQSAMDRFPKPLVAAMHGTVLGGGLEIALTCHARIAAPGTKFGLPEVKLGILPGVGGTQRLPRVAGAARALDMILSGEPIPAETALAAGILDAIAEGNLKDAGIALAASFAGKPVSRVRDRADKIADTDPQLFDEARAKALRSARGLLAPTRIIDCVQAACTLPFDDGILMERAALAECMSSPQRAALVHLFFAERQARKIDALKGASPTTIGVAAVLGAGTMGGGIAMCFANAGIPVFLLDVSEEALARGRSVIEKNYATSVTRGSLPQSAADAALAKISYVTEYAQISDADIVVEAVFEDIGLKKQIFAQLDAVMKPGAVLATNTSTLNIDEIANSTSRPEAVCGTHFFSPANVMRLLENVRGAKSSAKTLATAMELGRVLNKVTVLAGNCDGFIANRMQAPFGNEVDRLIEEGAEIEQIDRVMTGFGMSMGPVAVRDLVGIDTSWRIRDQRRKLRPDAQPPTPLLDRIYAAGRLGQKSGAGYYRYENRKAMLDPEVAAMIATIAVEMGVERQPIDDGEILDRLMLALVNEAAKILEDGTALRASDIDLAYVYGYGFPTWRGGPMFWAQNEGLDRIYEKISGYHARMAGAWKPNALLADAAKAGKWPR